jgi:uncharacterized membrane protein
MFMPRIRLLIAVLWVGSLWTIGYIVAPTLFATLEDRSLAGTIAGRLFRIEAWISLTCAATLVLLILRDKAAQLNVKACLVLVSAMLACTLIGHFGLQPFMAALRESGGVTSDAVRAKFGMLHGISSAIYLIQSVLGAVLLIRMR